MNCSPQPVPTEGGTKDQPSASIQPTEDVSGVSGQSEAHKIVAHMETEAGGGVTSQAGQTSQPVVSSEVQPQQQQQQSYGGQVTQSEEVSQVSHHYIIDC